MGGFDDLAAQFDPADTKRKGDQFEAVCKWFLENDPTYRPLLRRVWLWDEWPGRKGIDAGIDLVAEDHDGNLWAIQAKAYNPIRSISKADIDKFVAESSRKTFAHRLLIATTDKRHHIATRLMDDLGIPLLGLTQLREADDYLDWPATPAALRPSKPVKPKKPYPYQRSAINDVVTGFQRADRGQLIMACGTGKTLTAWFITEKLAAQRTLVLVPSLSLLKQTITEWRLANPTKPFAALPVCSDETVGSLGLDAAVSHTSDLGVPVTTNPQVIAEFLRKRSGPRVVFSTYQSSPQIAAAFSLGRVPGFDLVIADEAHRIAGPVSSNFATVLDTSAIKAKRRLFMTATPRFFTGRVLREAEEADYEVASMDDAEKFGEVFHRLSFAEAIDRGLLTDYQVAIIGVDDATYQDWVDRGAFVTFDGEHPVPAHELAGQIGLAKAMRKFDLRRIITFHSRVKAAREFAASMPAVLDWMPARQRPKGALWSQYASGEMSAGERSMLIGHLKRLDDGERGLLANARCLAEGVDVPALDGVAFIDPKRSEVDIVQAVGRAIRKSDDKTVGTIVIPVFIDTDEDAEVALDSSVFKPVWDVIKALRAHDTELGEQLDALRREMGRKGGKPKLPSKIHIDVPATVSKEFAAAFEARLVDATTATWEFWLGLLERYIKENGHALVPGPYKVDSYKLGWWVNNQRAFFSRGTLEVDRQQRLQAIPDWVWNVRDAQWEEAFRLLQEYVERHGDALVPISYKVDGYPLGSWVNRQRTRTRIGTSTLDADRRKRLQGVSGWAWDAGEAQWEEGFSRLQEYVKRHGDIAVPATYKVDGFRLGGWVRKQRAASAKGTLDVDRQRRLGALPGWVDDIHDALWEEGFNQLQEYIECHGDAFVPATYKHDGYPLGSWVRKQRRRRVVGTLEADRQQRLGALDGWSWDPFADKWEDGFNHLLKYVEENGHARVPAGLKDADGYELGFWVVQQRYKRNKGTLDTVREQRLGELDGWTWGSPRGTAGRQQVSR